jgi:branched-chain amino acid transport system substrate-binding protein
MGTPVIRKLLFTLCTLALTLTAGAYAAEPIAVEPIKVGTTQSLTGHYKDFGTEQLRGLQMWVADINARGALLGRPVELVHYDDGSRKVRSVEGYTRLIEQDKVDLLVGPYSSALTLEASAATEKYNIPMVASAASADEIWSRGLKNIFGIDTPSSRYLDLDTNVMALLDAKTMAVVYAQTPFAEDVIAGMRTNAAEDGVRIVLEESYPPEQLEFSDLATRLAQVDADVILGISYLNDSVALVRALKQANVKPKLLAFTVGPALKEFGDALGEDAEGVAGIVQWLRSIPLPGAQDFAYRYRKRYGENPGVHAVIGYSAGQVLETAVRLAGTTDKDAVREQLRTMYFRSLLGKYNVDETGRQEGKRNVMLQWQDNRRRLVAPANLAERKPIYPLP